MKNLLYPQCKLKFYVAYIHNNSKKTLQTYENII